MKSGEVTVVRVYLSEGHSDLDRLLQHLHDREKVRGVTVLRGIAGYGDSGVLHTAKLIDLSLDLPLVVEFFDEPGKIAGVLERLQPLFKTGHILRWNALINENE